MALLRYVVPCGVTFLIIQLVCMVIMAKLSLILLWPGLSSARNNKSQIDRFFVRPRCLGESFEPTWSPVHYNLRLDLNPEERMFRGEILIRGKMLSTASLIQLHSVNLTLNSVSLDGDEMSFDVNDDDGIVSIKSPMVFDVGKSLEITIKYEGIFHEDSGIMLKNISSGRSIIFTYLEPIYARKVFPCLDQPEYKATYGLSIRNPGKGLTVLSNMPQIVDPSIPEPKYIKFRRSPLMSTYLLSFVICDYVPIEGDGKVTIWAPEEKVDGVRWAAEAAPGLLKILENYVGIEFTLPKLDMFVAPKLGSIGGMENWGLVMLDETTFFLQQNKSKASEKVTALASLTHELAHSWFGNLVTVRNWCYTWVQEGIATYLHGRIGEQAFPWTDMVQNVKNLGRYVMDDEFYFGTQPLRLRKDIHPNDWAPFNLVAYYKGAFVLYMVESIVSPAVIRNALQSFVKNNAYSNVTDVDIWEEVDKAATDSGVKLPKSIKVLMKPWTIYEGHPVVTIFRDRSTGKLTAKQKIFKLSGKKKTFWWIPLSYTTSRNPKMGDTSPKLWMPPKNVVFDMNMTLGDDEWVIVNLKNSGYYRVNYDDRTWQLLAEQLESDHRIFDPVTRAVMIDDAFKLAMGGFTKYEVPLKLVKYLRNENDTYAWKTASANLDAVLAKMGTEEHRKPFKKYVQSLMDKIITDVIIEKFADRYSGLQSIDAIFDLATSVDHPKIYNFSIEIAQQVMMGRIVDSQISPDIRTALWCAAIRKGPNSIFHHRLISYKAETDPVVKAEILNKQLICSINNTMDLLNEILETNTKNELLYALEDFIENHWDSECKTILAFIENNQEQIFANQTQDAIRDLGAYVAFAPAECIEDTKRILNVDATRGNTGGKWRKLYSKQILDWLANNEALPLAG